MLKSSLAKRVAERHSGFFQADIDRITNAIIEEIAAALGRGGRVELRGFGTFRVKQRQARAARNPKTGKPVAVNRKSVPYFKASAGLLARLNEAP